MAYTLTTDDWFKKMGYTPTRWGNYERLELQTPRKPRPTPMRPIGDRIQSETEHFVIMFAVTNKWGGHRIALIEKACSSTPVTRIDPRLKSIKRIIRLESIPNNKHINWRRKMRRVYYEMNELIDKCERLYPCHFLVKGVCFETRTT